MKYIVFYANKEYHHCRTAEDINIAQAVKQQYLDLYFNRILLFKAEIVDKHPFPSEGVVKHHKTLPQINEPPRSNRRELSFTQTNQADERGSGKAAINTGNERKRTRKTPPTQYGTLF